MINLIRNKLKRLKRKPLKEIDQSVFHGAPHDVSAAYVTHEGVVFWISGKIERMDNGNWYFESMTNIGTPRGYKRQKKPIPILNGLILRANDDGLAALTTE